MAVTPHNVEPYHLNRVRDLYAEGRLSDKQLEPAIEHVLRGGYLDADLRFKAPVMDRVRARRKCNADGHNLVDVTGFGDPLGRHLCTRCDYRET